MGGFENIEGLDSAKTSLEGAFADGRGAWAWNLGGVGGAEGLMASCPEAEAAVDRACSLPAFSSLQDEGVWGGSGGKLGSGLSGELGEILGEELRKKLPSGRESVWQEGNTGSSRSESGVGGRDDSVTPSASSPEPKVWRSSSLSMARQTRTAASSMDGITRVAAL